MIMARIHNFSILNLDNLIVMLRTYLPRQVQKTASSLNFKTSILVPPAAAYYSLNQHAFSFVIVMHFREETDDI